MVVVVIVVVVVPIAIFEMILTVMRCSFHSMKFSLSHPPGVTHLCSCREGINISDSGRRYFLFKLSY